MRYIDTRRTSPEQAHRDVPVCQGCCGICRAYRYEPRRVQGLSRSGLCAALRKMARSTRMLQSSTPKFGNSEGPYAYMP